jgi:transcription antitermination factor NusG
VREQWFALHVRSRLEAFVCSALRNKGYETFLPKRNCASLQQSKGPAPVLFPGYVFCHFDVTRRLPVLQTPGVINVVGSGKTPVPVDEAELNYVRRLAIAGAMATPVDYLELGQKVRVEHGPLTGVEGVLTEIRNRKKLVISVSLLRRSVAVEIDPLCLRTPEPARWWTVAAAATASMAH